MSRLFLTSDSHFSHKNSLSFTKENGDPLRSFSSMDEMNQVMIERWNNVVNDDDIVLHLGDVVFAQSGFECLPHLKGRKQLLMGNHERHGIKRYLDHFEWIHAYAEKGGFILSHIPVHPSQIGRWIGNIHGHTHSSSVILDNGQIDVRYFCVSVEQTNFTPILFDDVVNEFKKRGIEKGEN